MVSSLPVIFAAVPMSPAEESTTGSAASTPALLPLQQLMLHTEALLFAGDRPLPLAELTGYLNAAFSEEAMLIEPAQVAEALAAIEAKYEADTYPFTVREIGGGYRFLTKQQYHATILHLNGDRHIKKLSTAAMETLAIVAYRGPVTKGEIEFIRGVSADYAIQKLLEKELIFISGRKEDAIGKPLLYMPSRHLMDYLGVNSAAELPQLKDLGTLEYVAPTPAEEAVPEDLLSGKPEAGAISPSTEE